MTTTPKKKRLVFWMIGIVLGTILLIAAGRYFDFPATHDSPPEQLADLELGEGGRFYVYSAGGFLDQTYCWRIDAPAADIERIIKHLGLRPSATVPNEFWRPPPYYWPRSLKAGMIPYRSIHFIDDARGQDGPHFFLLHDTQNHRAFVLFKQNF